MRIINRIARVATIAILLGGAVFWIANKNSAAQVQTGQGERKVKIRVGTTRAETDKGQTPELWAVVVGVSRFQNGGQKIEGNQITNLKYAADDAQAIYNFLRSDEGGSFRDVSEGGHMVLLKDEQATKANVEQALNNLKQAKPQDYFVIYIATHGVLVPKSDAKSRFTQEIPFFLLHDADPRDAESLERSSIRMDSVKQLTRAIPAKKGLVLSDACHSAAIETETRDAFSNLRANAWLIEEMREIPEGVGFITAARQTESSHERDELGHGVFTWSLLEGLRGQADKDQDGMVVFDEIAKHLDIEVPRLTQNKQHPHVNTTTLSANQIPLAAVRYAANGCGAACGTLVVRAPELDDIMVSLDDAQLLPLNWRNERAWKLPPGKHQLTFTRGQQREIRNVTIEPNQSLLFEVNLSFTQKDDTELIEAGPGQVNVHIRNERPASAEASDLFHKGVANFDNQQFEEAIETLTRAIQANGGEYADAFIYRGRAEQSLGRHKQAVASFQRALALRPTDYETRTLLAEARFAAGDNMAAVEKDLRAIIARHPNDDFARLVLADLLYLRRDLVEAEMQLRRAIRNRPYSPPAHLILADVLMDAGARDAELARRNAAKMSSLPNAKLAEAIKAAERALFLFGELARKRTVALKTPNPLAMSKVVLSGARYNNDASLAEANHALARALITAIEYDDTQAGNNDYLNNARKAIEEAAKFAKALRNPLRLAMVTETRARLLLLQGDVSGAIKEAENSLQIAASLPNDSDLKDFPDAHYTLYSAYVTSLQFGDAANHLQLYLQKNREKMRRRQQVEELRALEEELVSLRGKANAGQKDGKKKDDKKSKKVKN
ncbi:MAG TPA: tetratricopeptide repeat protein [Blastocatellia bacterium]